MENLIYTLECERTTLWCSKKSQMTIEDLKHKLATCEECNGDPNPQEFETKEAALAALAECFSSVESCTKTMTGDYEIDVEEYKVCQITLDEDGEAVKFELVAEAEWRPLPKEIAGSEEGDI